MTMQRGTSEPWPTELRLNPEKTVLRVAFGDRVCEALSAELLRVTSPSAEVQGHSPLERKLVAGKSGVSIREIEPIGNYAVRLIFSDGHNTGIYTWSYLHDLCQRKDELWEGYLKELAAAGLSRAPAK
jgi:DUF971 family protein